MPRLIALLPLTGFLALGCGASTQHAGGKLHDPDATASIEAFMRKGFGEMDTKGMDYWKKTACPQAVMWDLNETGQPVTASGKSEIDAALGDIQKVMDAGTKVATTLQNITCRSSTDVGHCLVEFDQTFTKDGKTEGPVKFRGTATLERVKGRWIWTHWHSSLRELPPQ